MGKDIREYLMKDLLIGENSQLAHYWKNNNCEIISRRLPNLISFINQRKWNRIYFAFSNGNTFDRNWESFGNFYNDNVETPLNLIKNISNNCNKIVFYSTTELWNKHEGAININTPFNFDEDSPYIKSKEIITNILLDKKQYENVIILYPFSFSCPMRKEKKFLFSKIFHSILKNEKVEVGNLDHHRDLLHPKFVVQESINATEDKIIGSGYLTHIRSFVKDIYNIFYMDYNEYVKEDLSKKDNRSTFYLETKKCLYSYNELFYDTCMDLVLCKEKEERINEILL